MARIARIVVPGMPHDVTQRGNRREPTLFEPADNRRAYLELPAAAARAAGTAVRAYCLMPDPVHLILVPALHGADPCAAPLDRSSPAGLQLMAAARPASPRFALPAGRGACHDRRAEIDGAGIARREGAMTMPGWAHGYVSDVLYTAGLYADQAPVHLDTALLVNGWEPVPRFGPLDYCELGCGQGLTVTLLAASCPQDRFWAVDFNPAHIATARTLCAAAGLKNLELVERSFEELLERGLGDRQFDVITLHGIYSWVAPEARRAIVELLRRHLAPGGAAYVSYNSLPGWTGGLPVQKALYEAAALAGGSSEQRLEAGLAFLARLHDAGSNFLRDNPFYTRILDQVAKGNKSYLVHEYLNQHWQPLYHAEVARDLAEAKLSYAGSSVIFENFPDLVSNAEQRALLATLEPGETRETFKDLFSPRLLRKDVFVRGPRRLSAARQDALLRETTLHLVVPRQHCRLTFESPRGQAAMAAAAYDPIFDALSRRPHRVDELLALAGGRLQAAELVGMLVGTRQAAPGVATVPDPAPARALNRILMQRARPSPIGTGTALAAPVLGNGLPITGVEARLYDELALGTAAEPDALARGLRLGLARNGEPLVVDGTPVEDEGEMLAVLRDRAEIFVTQILPLWRRLEVI